MQHPLGNPHAYIAEAAYELVSKPMYWWEESLYESVEKASCLNEGADGARVSTRAKSFSSDPAKPQNDSWTSHEVQHT